MAGVMRRIDHFLVVVVVVVYGKWLERIRGQRKSIAGHVSKKIE